MPLTRARLVRLCVLYCGQGMANWIEIFDENNPHDVPDANILVDFGRSFFSKDAQSKSAAVNYIVGRLNEMGTARKVPSIDWTIISHQDHDHWALLPPLTVHLRQFRFLKLGPITLGGALWSSACKAAIRAYAASVAPDAAQYIFNANVSDYGAPPAVGTYQTFGDVELRVLLARTTRITSTAPATIKNATSAVVVVHFRGASFLLPGDATVETIAHINTLLAGYGHTTNPKPLDRCYSMSLPHHGASRTLQDTDGAFGTARTFARFVEPESTAASAGYRNGHKHPQLGVIKVFQPYAQAGFAVENVVAFSAVGNDWTRFSNGGRGVFSTVVGLTEPVAFRRLNFNLTVTVGANGEETVVPSVEEIPIGQTSEPDRLPILAYPEPLANERN